MTEQQHPITPPPELVERLRSEAPHGIRDAGVTRERYLAIAAYRAGADQQLNADCEWLHRRCLISGAEELRVAMRPKPPSLTVRALAALAAIEGDFNTVGDRADIIRAALERLQELESDG